MNDSNYRYGTHFIDDDEFVSGAPVGGANTFLLDLIGAYNNETDGHKKAMLRKMIDLYKAQPSNCTPEEFVNVLQNAGYSPDDILYVMEACGYEPADYEEFSEQLASGGQLGIGALSGGVPTSNSPITGTPISSPTPRRKMGSGLKAVGKRISRPIWDFDRSGRFNGVRLARNVGGTVLGLGVGATTAAVQAGISITDGKYNPLEAVASLGAGVVGTKAVINKIGQNGGLIETYKKEANADDDEKLLEDYSKRWFDRQDVIDNFEKQFPGNGKAMRRRAARNYVKRGITNFEEQKQAMNFAEQLQEERSISEDEADRIAADTVQYRRSLLNQGNYSALFNKERRDQYLKTVVDGYAGNASRDNVRKAHLEFMQNVLDFDRANR